MGFSRSHNDELNAFERGRAGVDTPMSIRGDAVSLSMAIQVFDVPMSIRNDALPMASQANKKRFGYKN
ncbi:MAG: hypothetical protein IKC51_03420 [Myxococcaceae bacterium]|nr:hypothetical protein [Myxococcaceae bacterium]